jgi:hypothetical protein
MEVASHQVRRYEQREYKWLFQPKATLEVFTGLRAKRLTESRITYACLRYQSRLVSNEVLCNPHVQA